MKIQNQRILSKDVLLVSFFLIIYLFSCLIFNNEILIYGLVNLGWKGKVIFCLIIYHITIVVFSIYLHRSETHRSIELAPSIRYFSRFWLWFATGLSRAEWVAIHRLHHQNPDSPNDPHSPLYKGTLNLFVSGFEICAECNPSSLIEKYGSISDNDALEKLLFSKFQSLGLIIFLSLYILLFGLWGMVMWDINIIAITMVLFGAFAALTHVYGYRNFNTKDNSHNLMRIGILLNGEELHNNHHNNPTSAKLSLLDNEFDLGWFYIKMLMKLNLAKLRTTATVERKGVGYELQKH
ncbi:acyl-CoA desaturase [Legionella cherrii]|uniref:Stearoyl CoA 9-desaturase n=1 Tax=Legionella cherrii TaxID=28084 RepID=A0A0W0S4Y5_9GAMM|nr:fatty acid desaturase [Legionella cherrii]KTC78504.1 stearoyl CoA 9-desaturase [Legionella cherrii]VEB35089.1 stearoyl CoA 9-desaturase [Legionella cherrii]